MNNLLEETIDILYKNGRIESDVLWVGRGYNQTGYLQEQNNLSKNTWEYFVKNADFLYEDGFGCEEIPTDLIVVGKDFWLERHSYDGSEWWEFKSMPVEPDIIEEFVIR